VSNICWMFWAAAASVRAPVGRAPGAGSCFGRVSGGIGCGGAACGGQAWVGVAVVATAVLEIAEVEGHKASAASWTRATQ